MVYFVIGLCAALLLVNAILVIFATMLSSKISRREEFEAQEDCP